jgi:hypothetical protein
MWRYTSSQEPQIKELQIINDRAKALVAHSLSGRRSAFAIFHIDSTGKEGNMTQYILRYSHRVLLVDKKYRIYFIILPNDDVILNNRCIYRLTAKSDYKQHFPIMSRTLNRYVYYQADWDHFENRFLASFQRGGKNQRIISIEFPADVQDSWYVRNKIVRFEVPTKSRVQIARDRNGTLLAVGSFGWSPLFVVKPQQ